MMATLGFLGIGWSAYLTVLGHGSDAAESLPLTTWPIAAAPRAPIAPTARSTIGSIAIRHVASHCLYYRAGARKTSTASRNLDVPLQDASATSATHRTMAVGPFAEDAVRISWALASFRTSTGFGAGMTRDRFLQMAVALFASASPHDDDAPRTPRQAVASCRAIAPLFPFTHLAINVSSARYVGVAILVLPVGAIRGLATSRSVLRVLSRPP